jgi:hypothetical protein|tara:strand:+ start:40 stop:228 length:189 start_codon:yes stop_codon:yes gene_type:complete
MGDNRGRTYQSSYTGGVGFRSAGSRKGKIYYGGTSSNKRFGDARYADGLFKKVKSLYKSITK